MKSPIKILMLLILPVAAMAQDSVITISPSMFDKESDQVFIAAINGWIFKEGNDTNWAKKDTDIRSWKKLKPTELSAKYADKNGRVECWFRIKIKLDSIEGNKPFGIKLSTWAASDVYIDGELTLSVGNTGVDGKPFREFRPFGNPSFPVNLKPGREYAIALHFVDYMSTIPSGHLKSEVAGLISLIRITGPKYNSIFLIKGIKELSVYNTIWISVCTILSLLFWLLYFLNPLEKNLRLIALGSTFLTLAMFCSFASQSGIGMSYTAFMFYNLFFNLFIALTSLMMPLILVNIFRRSVTLSLKIFLVIFFTGWVATIFLSDRMAGIISVSLIVALLGVCIYYIISSWKKLKGAQWAIVVGLLTSLAWGLLFGLTVTSYITQTRSLFYLSITGYSLCFPLSLLIYVSIRFKEIIKEVRQNAQQVVQLSEEKKEQALYQQRILQEEVNKQTAQIRATLDNLKSTQTQLIQSEKMASLGELTAGIAHEIQNPLNFVNNFSELNKELIDEMENELHAGNNAEVISIAKDIKENEEKINQHGKRADAIVKGMLQHSRASTGQKESTDINALTDEYLRLSYQGLRAKDKTFNATLQTDFDESIEKLNIIPEDIGRVFINLYNNALYAVTEKKKQVGGSYEPTVSVSTKRIDGKVEIRVTDNGNGIPQKVLDKIFQPFFTTKPTGQGTGLGLSLAYDIIKAHGGEIKVHTTEGEFAEFVIQLPIAV